MIIGITGYLGSGKDTAAAYIVANYDYVRKAFADKLKDSLSALLDIPSFMIDELKLNETVFVATGYKNEPSMYFKDEEGNLWQPGIDYPEDIRPNHMWSPVREFTFREILQRYGTEAHREVFGNDFWVDQVLPYDGRQYTKSINMVISDCRFKNELERVRLVGGRNVRINREGCEPAEHASENLLPDTLIDYELQNNGTFEDLYAAIDTMLYHFSR